MSVAFCRDLRLRFRVHPAPARHLGYFLRSCFFAWLVLGAVLVQTACVAPGAPVRSERHADDEIPPPPMGHAREPRSMAESARRARAEHADAGGTAPAAVRTAANGKHAVIRKPDGGPVELEIGPLAVPGGEDDALRLEPAPLESGDRPLPINLATALALSDARPLVVAAAQAGAWVAEAELQRAQVRWVPAFDIGAAYLRHDGVADFNRGRNPTLAQREEFDFQRQPLLQNFNWFYTGFSLYQIVALTDAIFEPLAARRVLNSRRWDIQTAKNDALLSVAEAYFRVHRHRGIYAGARDAARRCRSLVERISGLSEDLVPRVEADRAKELLADLDLKATMARREWRVASADLTQVLRLDPSVVVVPLEQDHLQITLIDPSRPLDELIAIGVANRPELASQNALIQAAEQRVRREKYRPLLPTVLFTGWQTPGGMRTQVGLFGTGPGHDLNNWSYRNDVSFQLVWQLEGMGFGNLARIKEQRGEESRATIQLFDMQDTVAGEVTATQADLQSAAVRVVQAERSVRDALITYNRNYEGLSQTSRFADVLEMVTRPQEAVVALEQLMGAYEAYFATVAEYNQAQFALFHALGYPARNIATLRRPGELVPVETERPFGLPSVGEGPPPATH